MPAVRDAILAFKRAPLLSALSVTTIAFSLFAVGLFGLVVLNIRNALESYHDAQQALDMALNLFTGGYLPLEQRCQAENL